MTSQDAIEMIKANCFSGDNECDHEWADDILCKFLKELGYIELVEAWKRVGKWYA